MFGEAKKFTVTEEHLKLARRMYVGYDEYTEFGAPEIDPKRPYGNSDVYGDMYEILGIEEPDEDDSWNVGTSEQYLQALHREMATVLQIALRTGSFEVGTYEVDAYSVEWRKLDAAGETP